MPAKTDPNSGIAFGFDDGDANWGSVVNENFERLSRLSFQASVDGVHVSAPPASPSDGDSYIVGANPTGAWSSFTADQIVHYNGTSWVSYTASHGWVVFDKATNRPYVYTNVPDTANNNSLWSKMETGVSAQALTQTAYDALTTQQKNEDKLYLIHS